MIGTFVWQWPQITFAVLIVIRVIVASVIDGDPRKGKHSFAITFTSILIWAVVSYFGGFWTEVRP